MPSFILIHRTVWPQYTNIETDRQTDRQTDRRTGQRSDSTERTVLQTVTNGGQKKQAAINIATVK